MKQHLTAAERRERDSRRRLADPTTFAAMDAAGAEARARYESRYKSIWEEIQTLLAGRKPRDLAGDDAVRFMQLRAQFDAVGFEQKRFVEAVLHRRLYGDDGGGQLAPVE